MYFIEGRVVPSQEMADALADDPLLPLIMEEAGVDSLVRMPDGRYYAFDQCRDTLVRRRVSTN